jgi:predicted  nucleic acid-binding Zn-ribbon protein
MSTTTAATEARRAATEKMLQRLTLVLRQMRREHAAVTVAAVARRAAVSRTFLYQNARARTLIASAAGEQTGSAGKRDMTKASAEATWRERALNAEHELKRTHQEIATQRNQIGELLGRIRDLEHDLPEDGVKRVLDENHSLRAQVRQLTQDNRRLEERLAGARDNYRSLDSQVARLEAELAENMTLSDATA